VQPISHHQTARRRFHSNHIAGLQEDNAGEMALQIVNSAASAFLLRDARLIRRIATLIVTKLWMEELV